MFLFPFGGICYRSSFFRQSLPHPPLESLGLVLDVPFFFFRLFGGLESLRAKKLLKTSDSFHRKSAVCKLFVLFFFGFQKSYTVNMGFLADHKF